MRSKMWKLWRWFVEVFLFIFDVLIGAIMLAGLILFIRYGHQYHWRFPW